MTSILLQSALFLMAAVITVPLSKRLGLGSVLGYLIAGILIGPVFGLVGHEVEEVQHIAEFGVVMMLFLVGLELEPQKLWKLKHKLLGLGGLQVAFSTWIVFGVGLLLGMEWKTAYAVGLILSLSSTAIVLQTLKEKGFMRTEGGQSSFSVLLFQDIAVIPILAFLPVLAIPELMALSEGQDSHHNANLLSGFPGWLQTVITLAIIGGVVLTAHFLIEPICRFIAASQLREMFTAFTLLIVTGISALMAMIDLSPALGTFIAGVILANSDYRHELEANIEPFKGLFLGIFFITVGAGINFALLQEELGLIVSLTLGIIAIKAIVLAALSFIFKLPTRDKWLLTFSLAQAGEFGFVLLSFSTQNAVIPKPLADQLLLVIALSMLLTPLLFIFLDKVIFPALGEDEVDIDSDIEPQENIILAGNGRFGQLINRILKHCGYNPTVIDLDVEAIQGFSKMGMKTFFGDVSRPELLAAAGIDEARLMIVAVGDREKAIQITAHVRKIRPDIKIIARAFDRRHCYDLYSAGADEIIREMYDSSIRAAKESLVALGINKDKAAEVADFYFHRDRHIVQQLAELHDPSLPRFGNQEMIDRSLEMAEETQAMMEDILNDTNTVKTKET